VAVAEQVLAKHEAVPERRLLASGVMVHFVGLDLDAGEVS
jgi:folate-dependent phosphoribosylglycinamide formyltransferase PurN